MNRTMEKNYLILSVDAEAVDKIHHSCDKILNKREVECQIFSSS